MIDKVLFGFAICRCIPEIFATKVESCQKSGRIMDDFFRCPKFQGAGLPKVIPVLSPLPRGTSPGKSFVRILPVTAPDHKIRQCIQRSALFPDRADGGNHGSEQFAGGAKRRGEGEGAP